MSNLILNCITHLSQQKTTNSSRHDQKGLSVDACPQGEGVALRTSIDEQGIQPYNKAQGFGRSATTLAKEQQVTRRMSIARLGT
jgi:hypothetical protein